MQVIIEINGRQALPVRAIPLLTDWHGVSPDQLAKILAGGSDHLASFDGLAAHRLQPDGSTELIPPRWWASWVVRKLQATSDAIKAVQISQEAGYQQWRSESLAQLPAGVFVWRDEFEAAHTDEYGPEGMRARGGPNGFDPSVHALDFDPQPDPAIAPPHLVLEGFMSHGDAGGDRLERLGGKEPSAHSAPSTPAPVEPLPALPVKETPVERRARWLCMVEEEEKHGKRGALQRVADREGADRSNMGKDIAKARGERDTQRRAGAWTSQLVQDGKRAH